MSQEAALPVRTPRWFVILRAISKTLVYGLVIAWLGFIPVHQVGEVILQLLLGVLWATILAATVIDVLHRRRTQESRLARISDVAMLLAPLPLFLDLPAVSVVLLAVGYVMQLRRISAGQVFMFAIFGSVAAIVLGTIALIGAESTQPGSSLAQPAEAAGFTLATLFRITSLKLSAPMSDEGRAVVVVLQVFSAIFLGALYGGLLAMVVKDSSKKSSSSTTDARLAYVIKQQQEILKRLDALAPKVEAVEDSKDQPPAGPP